MSKKRNEPLWVIAGRTLRVEDSWFGFAATDLGADNGMSHALHELTDDQWLATGDNWVGIGSGTDGSSPLIVFEAWPREPSRDLLPAHTHELEITARFDSRILSLFSTSDVARPAYYLPPADDEDESEGDWYVYRLRFRVRRDSKISHRYRRNYEAWRIQVWPVKE